MQRLHQEQKQQQTLRLTPQQLLTAQLIEMSNAELQERIRQEAEENPVIELVENSDEGAELDLSEENETEANNEEEFSLEDYLNDDDSSVYELSVKSGKEKPTEHFWGAQTENFHESILRQFLLRNITESQRVIGEFIIGCMDNNGYIKRPLSMMVTDMATSLSLQVKIEELKEVLLIIQQLDPPGIGAQSLQECLLIQIQNKLHIKTPSVLLAHKILTKHFDNLANKRYKKILTSLQISSEELQGALSEILKLNPKPGFGLDGGIGIDTLIPDFSVEYKNEVLTCQLASGDLPTVRISKNFERFNHQLSLNSQETTNFLRRNLTSAQNFVEAIHQRNMKLLNIMQTILHLQYDYFITGDRMRIKPMVIRNVQEILKYDISIISRAISKKYAQTHFGIVALKSLFSEAHQTQKGEGISSASIKEQLLKIITNEDPNNPIPDEQLMTILQNQGISIARRTIAKYREQLGFQPARLRKKLVLS